MTATLDMTHEASSLGSSPHARSAADEGRDSLPHGHEVDRPRLASPASTRTGRRWTVAMKLTALTTVGLLLLGGQAVA
jgi:hypothetical protein